MAEAPGGTAGVSLESTEIRRLNKIIRVLMDRAERSTSVQGSDFSLFQTSIMLEERVRRRTTELEAALRENEKINRALRESEAKFRGLVSQSLVGIVLVEDGRFTYSNGKFEEMLGYSAEEIADLGPVDIAVEGDRGIVEENLRQRMSGEVDHVDYVFRARRKDGSVMDIECHSNGMDLGGRLLMISLLLDITERSRAERELRTLQERLREQSTHDALTGLYNRRYLEESLGRELSLAGRNGRPVSVIIGDLDHFKAVNDCYGHLAGDEVLRVFGAMMNRQTRESDISCRWGGEEFLVVLPGMGEQDAVGRAEQLRCALSSAPISFGATQISVTASFGVASYPRDGQTRDALLAAADTALYAGKAAGRNRVNVCVPAPAA